MAHNVSYYPGDVLHVLILIYPNIDSASNAITGAGVDEGVEWLCSAISGRHK